MHGLSSPLLNFLPCAENGDSISEPDQSASEVFDPIVVEDLTYQLKDYWEQIKTEFAFFTSAIHDKLVEHKVSVSNLRYFLLQLPACESPKNDERNKLLFGLKNEIQKAVTVDEVLLSLSGYISFLDYKIYLSIARRYNIDVEKEKCDYIKHLDEYVNKHRLSDLVAVIPTLCKYTDQFSDVTKTLVFKFNIKMSCKFSELVELKSAAAKLLGCHPSALRLISIDGGSVLVTFLTSAFVAERIISNVKKLTQHEMEQFRALSIVWLEYEGNMFDFSRNDDPDGKDEVEAELSGIRVGWHAYTMHGSQVV